MAGADATTVVRRRGRCRRPARQPLLRRHRRLDLPPAGAGNRRVPSGQPRSAAAVTGSRQLHHLHVRVPQHHRAEHRPTPGAEEQGPAQRAAVLGRPVRPRRPARLPRRHHQPRPRRAARPDRLAHMHWHGFATSSRSSTASPSGSVAVPIGTRCSATTTDPATRRHVHVPLPLRGRRARAHGHDRHRVRAAPAGRQHRPLSERQVHVQRRRRLDRLRPRVLDVPLRGVGRIPLGRLPHPAARVERLPRRLPPPQRTGIPGHDHPNGSIDPSTQ